MRQPIVMVVIVIALLGVLTNVMVASCLAWWPCRSTESCGISNLFGVREDTRTYAIMYWGSLGRDSVTISRSPPVADPPPTLNDFRTAYFKLCSPRANRSAYMTLEEYTRRASKLFPDHAAWATEASDATPVRRVYASGFPFRSFVGYAAQTLNGAPLEASAGLVALDKTDPARAIPFIPIVEGAAANTMIFALPWAVLVGIGPCRRKLRLRRGHCPFCGYDLRGDYSRVCSECGRSGCATPRSEGEA